jgi:putative hemolysin
MMYEAQASQSQVIEGAVPSKLLAREINRLGAAQVLFTNGDCSVAIARSPQIPYVLREIGRLREINFRAVGEGTGRGIDLDQFDEWYMHLFVWDRRLEQVLGAYRIGMTDVVLRQRGIAGLYTSTLFDYAPGFFEQLGCALEMGRSFVRAESQRTRVLACLWRGIGRLIALRPRYTKLFGPVSISANYSEQSRRFIAAQLLCDAYRHDLCGAVNARRPLSLGVGAFESAGLDIKQLSKRVAEMEPTGAGLPVLVREYLKLGGRFLGFSVDPAFGNALDGLVAVDLLKTEPRLLNLYMGQQAHELFVGTHAREVNTEASTQSRL